MADLEAASSARRQRASSRGELELPPRVLDLTHHGWIDDHVAEGLIALSGRAPHDELLAAPGI
jgi:hypothetical protein